MEFRQKGYSIIIVLLTSVFYSSVTYANSTKPIKDIIAGQYICQGVKKKIKRKLTLIETPQHIDIDKRFYTYNVYFSGNVDQELTEGNKVFSNAIGYMIVDTQKLSAVGYLENQVDNRIRGAGLIEFELTDSKPVKFSAYFIDRFRDKMGIAHCEQVLKTVAPQPN
ncbi:hypothetical protein [Shewanella surugensis]|uniref:DUF4354 family protein n=1 Tax=Shewanella surugensis TaxID=212020 RepID=A0ABT0LD74_9GAMM|nr:hypothetical protein [Shewanella surugensis]MCL1125106.1 hypothetical protein [Shewanella surugensis]